MGAVGPRLTEEYILIELQQWKTMPQWLTRITRSHLLFTTQNISQSNGQRSNYFLKAEASSYAVVGENQNTKETQSSSFAIGTSAYQQSHAIRCFPREESAFISPSTMTEQSINLWI